MKLARNSFDKPYECKKDWSEDCFVQCGDSGVVFSKEGNYTTAFFEAFPRNPDTFIRGEGATIEEAEQQAWDKLQKYSGCTNHEWEKRGYTNGAGFCKHCNMFASHVFLIETTCCVCNKVSNYSSYGGKTYCKEHFYDVPEESRDHVWKTLDGFYKRNPDDYNKPEPDPNEKYYQKLKT